MRVKPDLTVLEPEAVKDHIGSRQRRMPAKIDLDLWRKPANVISVPVLYKKRCLSQIVLRGDLLHRLVRQPISERHDSRRVAAEWHLCKCVNLKNFEFHKVYAWVSANMVRSSNRSACPRCPSTVWRQ